MAGAARQRIAKIINSFFILVFLLNAFNLIYCNLIIVIVFRYYMYCALLPNHLLSVGIYFKISGLQRRNKYLKLQNTQIHF